MFCVASYTEEVKATDGKIYFEGTIMILTQNIFLVEY